ncbi:GNAT family N-acetyltransferase [Proteinivorax hydrogeniformans]|uniref:GNAT family N-acetyltransferase n=1 Tax=Proteinivorax hydrogeniformans TaxID=1826727 RepID=A0AAU8HRI7_9FIRM
MHKVNDVNIINDLLKEDMMGNINTLGRLKFQKDFNIFVDSLNKPQGYVLQNDNWNVVYSDGDATAEKLLNSLLDKPQNFAGVLRRFYDLVEKKGIVDWKEFCYLYYITPESLKINQPKHNVDSLTLDDAEIVDYYYTYRSQDPNSLEYLKGCIKERPSSVIRDENGKPISWALIREDGSLGVMYTKKEHRGKGLAISVSVDLIKKAFELGHTPYVHIVTDNKASIALSESIGFKRYGEIVWFGTK